MYDLTYDEFENNLKFFARFLKEKGYYSRVMSYIFYGQSKKDLYAKFKSEDIRLNNGSMVELLNRTILIKKSFDKTGISYWSENIREVYNNFRQFIFYSNQEYDE